MDRPLSLALRTETSSAHEDAEGSAFVEQLMGGLACRPAFAREDFEAQLATGEIHTVPAAADYATTLRTEHTPEAMLAHHYVRYLGDLSGGQIIARMVQRHYGIDAGTRRRIVGAAVDSFELNRRVFADLGAARAPEHAAAGGPA